MIETGMRGMREREREGETYFFTEHHYLIQSNPNFFLFSLSLSLYIHTYTHTHIHTYTPPSLPLLLHCVTEKKNMQERKRRIANAKRSATKGGRYVTIPNQEIRSRAPQHWDPSIAPSLLQSTGINQQPVQHNIVPREQQGPNTLTESRPNPPPRRYYRQLQQTDPNLAPSVFPNANPAHNHDAWKCRLQCIQCIAKNRDGSRCKRTVCIGLPFCSVHMKRELRLKISTSTIAAAGKGLFAYDPSVGAQGVVFPEDSIIVEYAGERLTHDQTEARYVDETTTPYAFNNGRTNNRRFVVDAACIRGIGAMINHDPDHANVTHRVVNNPDWITANNSRAQSRLTHDTPGLGGVGPWQIAPFRMYIVAAQDILHGQEILLHYGAQYQFDDINDSDVTKP